VARAAHDSGFTGLTVERVSFTLPGELVDVRVPRGQTVDKLDGATRAIAGCLRVTDVRVVHDREDRSHAQLSIIRRDPFQAMSAMSWPLLEADSVNLREPFPFGLDEFGRDVQLRLLARNLILGGAPDAGKSASLRVVAAAAALDPRAKLWMMDAKTGGAEFVHWAPAAEEVVRGRDLTAAVEMLARLEERIELRGQEIVARGEVFVCEDMELDVLMIDELPQFTRSFEERLQGAGGGGEDDQAVHLAPDRARALGGHDHRPLGPEADGRHRALRVARPDRPQVRPALQHAPDVGRDPGRRVGRRDAGKRGRDPRPASRAWATCSPATSRARCAPTSSRTSRRSRWPRALPRDTSTRNWEHWHEPSANRSNCVFRLSGGTDRQDRGVERPPSAWVRDPSSVGS
jgi:hypothetical protein